MTSETANRRGPGHITLEALLDSPGLTPPSPLADSINGTMVGTNSLSAMSYGVSNSQGNSSSAFVVVRAPELTPNERQILINETCLELLSVLKQQDVNGYFLFPVLNAKHFKKNKFGTGLLDLEQRVLLNEYKTLSDFQRDITELFNSTTKYYESVQPAYTESLRFLNLIQDWFASLDVEHVKRLNASHTTNPGPISSNKIAETAQDSYLERVTTLRVLNPDNNGITDRNERIRSIGDEVGPLRSGSFLLPNGGYREDRRNKVIPYTYLDYGPFYSFAPSYDSGASHCTPEANQLLLHTTWLPARSAFVLDKSFLPGTEGTIHDGEEYFHTSEELVSAALNLGDQQLAVALATAELEQQLANTLSAELEEILPGPEVAEDCVFSMCLANALTRGWASGDQKTDLLLNSKTTTSFPSTKSELETGSQCEMEATAEAVTAVPMGSAKSCDLDSADLTKLSHMDESTTGDDVCNINCDEYDPELSESAHDLRALYCAQYLRLGNLSQSALPGQTIEPSQNELTIAHRLVGRFVNLVKRTRPGDLIHPYTVRRAMNMNPDDFFLPDDEVTHCPVNSLNNTDNSPTDSDSALGSSS